MQLSDRNGVVMQQYPDHVTALTVSYDDAA
jgi:hypothetical protein